MSLSKFIWDCWKEHIETHVRGMDKNQKKQAKLDQAKIKVTKKAVLEQATFACADANVPFTIFANPSMSMFLEKLGMIRDETNEEAYLLLLDELKSRRANINRLGKLSESFKLVSFGYFFSRYLKIVF